MKIEFWQSGWHLFNLIPFQHPSIPYCQWTDHKMVWWFHFDLIQFTLYYLLKYLDFQAVHGYPRSVKYSVKLFTIQATRSATWKQGILVSLFSWLFSWCLLGCISLARKLFRRYNCFQGLEILFCFEIAMTSYFYFIK